MNIWKRLFGRQEVGEEHVMQPRRHVGAVLKGSGFRKGMWVVYDNYVGILARAFTDGTVELHLVNAQGVTYLIEPLVPLAALRQAKYEEIPEARRPPPEKLTKGGYR